MSTLRLATCDRQFYFYFLIVNYLPGRNETWEIAAIFIQIFFCVMHSHKEFKQIFT